MNESLCFSCGECNIVQMRNNRKVIKCFEFGLVNEPVESCTMYRNKTQPTQYELEKIAWMIDPKPKGKAGFKPPEPTDA